MTRARNDDDYRPGVGIILLNAKDRVFVAQRIDSPGPAWQMPQGGIDAGESPQEAALRELEEETGTALAEMLHEMPGWFYYELPDALCQSLWGGRFCGQRQRWFILRFTGTDADINIATAHPEFSAWRWV
ncbi:MAG: RNA pyrophosphohydrolase [Alphaproteobacteria bacterium]|nr:RNA pyrophosphohydrolase [Alphaproteobacteria bacterium]